MEIACFPNSEKIVAKFPPNHPKLENSGRKKGSLNKKTLIAKAAGVENWNDLAGWIEGPGIKRYVEEIQKLKGIQFTQELRNIAEFVRPKLARTEHAGHVETITYNVDVSAKKIAEIKKAFENDY